MSRATCQRKIQPIVYNTDQKDLSANRSVLWEKKDAEDRLLCDAFYLDTNITWWDFCPLTKLSSILKYDKSFPLYFIYFVIICQILISGKIGLSSRNVREGKKQNKTKHGTKLLHRGHFYKTHSPGCWWGAEAMLWSETSMVPTVSSVSGCITSLSNDASAHQSISNHLQWKQEAWKLKELPAGTRGSL